MGRPQVYSDEQREEIAQHIFGQVASGRSVASILKNDPGMPAAGNWWIWHMNNVSFQERLVRARELGVEALLDEAIAIVDGDDIDHADTIAEPGSPQLARAAMRSRDRRASMRAEMRVKMAQMIAPKKYGAKLDLTSDNQKLSAGPAQDDAVKIAAILNRVEQRVIEHQPQPDLLAGLGEEARKLLS